MNLLLRNRNPELDPVEELDRVQRELARIFDSGSENAGLLDRSVAPAVDLLEKADAFELLVDLPGVEKKDLDLSVENNVLSIKGEKKEGKEIRRFIRKETWEGNFRRTIALPQSVDPEKVQAVLADGVLVVTVGKREELKPRQISVSVK